MRIGLLCLALCAEAAVGFGGTFVPVSLEKVANASRMDEMPGDGKGGWLDLGSNDLRVLPAGRRDFGGVTFDVPACPDERSRTCLVLGRRKEESVRLDVPAGVRGGRFYLLHAIAGGPAPEKREAVAEIKFYYADGSKAEKRIRTGRDTADWTSSRTCENAVRAWSAYNDNTQVSLFLSGFDLNPRLELTAVKFKAKGNCPWMIVAATAGKDARVKGLQSQLEISETFRAPPPQTQPLKAHPAGDRPKNVILLIGDGMGLGALRFASLHQHGREDALQMQQLPFAGLCTTLSSGGGVTDSAAAATAIATGSKTGIGALGMRIGGSGKDGEPQPLVSFAEKAHEAGRAVALLTNDRIWGATPAGFYAHVASRGQVERIAEQSAASGYEVLVGSSGSEKAFRPDGRKDGRDMIAEMEKSGYAFVRSQADFAAVPRERKVIGTFLEEAMDEESVAVALKTALGRVGNAPKGFFMMCESALPDHGNHGNRPVQTVKGVLQVDWAVAAALDFAEKRGDTLVLVTADHETGGVSAVRSRASGKATIHYSSSSHTGAPVAIFAYGPGAERFEGLLDNTDIARTLTQLLELKEDDGKPVADADVYREFLAATPARRHELMLDAAFRARMAAAGTPPKGAPADGVPRWYDGMGVANLRDLGGWTGLDGRKVRTGILFRSAHLSTVKDKRAFRETYGVKTDLDLREPKEIEKQAGVSPLGRSVRLVNLSAPTYQYFGKPENRAYFATVFRTILKDKNRPLLFHCAKGADRTGSIAFLLNGLLGVSESDLVLDWEVTAFFNPNPKFADAERIDKMVEMMRKEPGATWTDKFVSYAKSCGILDAEIARFRSIMLEDR